MDQSTIKKLVDMQFKEVGPIIRLFLLIYIFGFIIPMGVEIMFMSKENQKILGTYNYLLFNTLYTI